MSNEWSTFADGYDCKDCVSWEKDVLKLKSKVQDLEQKLAKATDTIRFYAENKTSVIGIYKDTVTESNFVTPGSTMTTFKTLDDGTLARTTLAEIEK